MATAPNLVPKMQTAACAVAVRAISFVKASQSTNLRGSAAHAKATKTVQEVDVFAFKTDTAALWPVTPRIVVLTVSIALRCKPKAASPSCACPLKGLVLPLLAPTPLLVVQGSFAKTVYANLNPWLVPQDFADPVKAKRIAKTAGGIAWGSLDTAIALNLAERATFALRVMSAKNPTRDSPANVCPKMGLVSYLVCLTRIAPKAKPAQAGYVQNPKAADLRRLAIPFLAKIHSCANAPSAANAASPLVVRPPEKLEAPVAMAQAAMPRCLATPWRLPKTCVCIRVIAIQIAAKSAVVFVIKASALVVKAPIADKAFLVTQALV